MTNRYEYELSDLIPIVSELVTKYTSGESSSVTYEVATQLMKAVEYCIQENRSVDESLMDNENDSYRLIRQQDHCSAKEAYQQGYKIVLAKVKQVRKIYNELSDTFLSYGNENYYETVMKGIPGFLTHYDSRFNPQNQILTLDYPLLLMMEDACGADLILDYMKVIELEQEFLHQFPQELVENILKRYHKDYERMFFNLCYPVLSHALCCMIVGKKVSETEWSQEECEQLEEYVLSQKRSQVHADLNEKLHQFLSYNGKDTETLFRYLQTGIGELVSQMCNAVQHECIETLFYQG